MKSAQLLLALALLSCSTDGPRIARESSANRMIGKTPEEAFRGLIGVSCYTEKGEQGCMLTRRGGCKTWHRVDPSSGLISGWRYESRPEDCWKHDGVGLF